MEKVEPTDNHNEPQLSPLGEPELEAMRMWFEGHSSPEIERALAVKFGTGGVRADTVRRWFSRGGKLYEIYREYAETEAKIRRKEATDMFRAHLKVAVRELVRLLISSSQDAVRIAAAREIINRELGEPPKVIAVPKKKSLAREILLEAGLIDGSDPIETGTDDERGKDKPDG